jgi:hypothetical protein
MLAFIHAHLGAVLATVVGSSSILTGFAVKFLTAKIPGLITSEEAWLIDHALAKLSRPEDKTALKAVLLAVKARFPDAGSAVFALAADACVKDVPALAPYRDALVGLFKAVEQAAAQGMVTL